MTTATQRFIGAFLQFQRFNLLLAWWETGRVQADMGLEKEPRDLPFDPQAAEENLVPPSRPHLRVPGTIFFLEFLCSGGVH